ncbi:hypothetical protein XaC1_500 [Xanthomonas phage XaC1]|nr:hypothetical protein XaC1_500 [Xanthomonas phage XaC1]
MTTITNEKFRKSLIKFHDGSPLSDKDLEVLHDHFHSLEELVKANPDLEAIKLYAYTHLNRINDYIRARAKK